LHTTRHTAATLLRASGVDEQTRMEILGHNSPEVTRIYAHADQVKNSTMMDALGMLLPARDSSSADETKPETKPRSVELLQVCSTCHFSGPTQIAD
jgi:hypothetical protein